MTTDVQEIRASLKVNHNVPSIVIERILDALGYTWEAIDSLTMYSHAERINLLKGLPFGTVSRLIGEATVVCFNRRRTTDRMSTLPPSLRLANLTLHAINLYRDGKCELVIPSIFVEARATSIEQKTLGTTLAIVDDHQTTIVVTTPQRFVGVTVPPFARDEYDGVIVSMATAQTLERTGPPKTATDDTMITRRLLVFTPGELVRNETGKIIGATTLELYAGVLL